MRRQKSDDRVVPEGRRKASPIGESRGGKAVTVEEAETQLGLFGETAETSQETPRNAASPLVAKRSGEPKSTSGTSTEQPAPMTMEEIADETNLKKAFLKVASNRGAPGPDRQSIDDIRSDVARCLSRVSRALLEGNYRPGEIRRVWIPKASGGQRALGIPNVVDRIVQQAVHQVLGPHFEKEFHDGSHGFRPRRSCHTAIKQAKQHVETGHEWVVDIDLEKFFDRVNHDRLMWRLEQHVADRRVLSLIRRMLVANVVMPDGLVVSNDEGTPQGGPLSPLLSNVVLDELDRELDRRGHRFVRYADDCKVYVQSERSGHRVMESLTRFIEKRLKLKVNRGKSAVTKAHGNKFLGLQLHKLKTGEVCVRVAEQSWCSLRAKLKALTPRNWGRSVDACIDRVNAYLRGWLGHFAICDDKQRWRLKREDGHLRRRLRAMVLADWGPKRHILRQLIRLGVPAQLARYDVYSRCRRSWSLSHVRAVDRGLNVDYFDQRGLRSLHDTWSRHHERIWNIGPKQLALPLG